MSLQPWSTPLPDAPWLAAVVWLYLGTNALRVVTYLPQIVTVWRCREGARSISLLTWASWTVSHVFAVLYGTLVAHDLPLVLIALINLVGCGAVTIIAMWRRRQWERAGERERAMANAARPIPLRRPRALAPLPPDEAAATRGGSLHQRSA